MNIKPVLSIAMISIFLNACDKPIGDTVIATVGKSEITQNYIENKLLEISPDYQNYLLTENGKKQFLDILINERLILLDAKSNAIGKSEMYKQQIRQMEKELNKKLDEFKNYLLTKMWIEELKTAEIKISEEEIKVYHDKYPHEVTVEQILLPTYKEAEEIYKKVKSGRNFSKIAKEKSMFTGLSNGGRLPPMMKGEFIPELEDMAFKMKTKEVQGIVKTKFGFHILRKISQQRLAFDKAAQDRIKRILEKKKFDEYIEGLQAKYKIEVLDEKYK
ncbi:MAG: peptidylprolyl isomerase [Elusimicrobia bacterium]|nr:peptidylprolyl isomerase [Elusimicrobiota bacterium]